MVAQCGPYVVVYRIMSDASSDFALNNDFCTLNNGLKITMKRPARQAVETQNQLAQGRNSQEPHAYLPSDSKCFQVAPNSAPSPNIHTFAVRDSCPQILLWCKRILAAIYWPNIQQYPAISTYTGSESRNAMSSASPHSLRSMMRDHVLISGKVNSFAWHNLDRSTTGANMMQDSLKITLKYQDCTPPKLNRAERQQAEQVSQHLGSVRQLNEVYILYITDQ